MTKRSLLASRILGSAAAVGVLTLVVKSCGAAKELAVAFRFGTAHQLGAFLFAYIFLAFLINVLSAALQMALVPIYLRVQAAEGAASANMLAGRVATLTALSLAVGAVVLMPTFAWLVPHLARGFDPPTVKMCQWFVLLLAPGVVLGGLATIWAGVLNANGRFAFAASVPIATPACVVLFVLWLGGSIGAYALVVGTLAGSAIEATLLATRVRTLNIPAIASVVRFGPNERRVAREFVPAAGANILMAATMLIEQSFAASISARDVAAYSFGTRLTGVAGTVLVTTLSTVLLPHFSRVIAASGERELRRSIPPVVGAVMLVAVPTCALFAGGSSLITHLFYEHGRFDSHDAALVSAIQAIHALYIPIFSLGMIAVRLVNALSASRLLMVGSGLNLLASVALNGLLVPYLGVRGIAWSNVGIYAVSATFLWCVVFRLLARRRTEAHVS